MHMFDLAMMDRDNIEGSTNYLRTGSIPKQYKGGAKQRREPKNDSKTLKR